MVNMKIRLLTNYNSYLESDIQNFLNTIDVRQILKIEIYQASDGKSSCLISYLDQEDIRDINIDSIIDKKIL